MLININSILKRTQITGTLETICQDLELSETQYKSAESRYNAVGSWLAASDAPLLRNVEVYSQGSFSQGTTVKPLDRKEYDVDLVCFVPGLSPETPPSYLKKLIGDRLRLNGHYEDKLQEKPRCWRISYANEFHLDITPSIFNPTCLLGGELVPDKVVNEWKPSNPKGYKQWFMKCAELQPRLLLMEAAFAEARAQVETLPGPTSFKGLLRRIVQLSKRHRDIWFTKKGAEFAPISIILTTLIAKSYTHCVEQSAYETEFDLFLDVLRQAPNFVETKMNAGTKRYYVWNETTKGENFAEKWNQDSRFAESFFSWQRQACSDFEKLVTLTGWDQINKFMSPVFGEDVVSKAMTSLTDAVTTARTKQTLVVTAGLGLGTSKPNQSRGTTVRPNTFFGS